MEVTTLKSFKGVFVSIQQDLLISQIFESEYINTLIDSFI